MEQEKNEWCHGSLDLQYVHNLPEALHYKLTEWIIFQKKIPSSFYGTTATAKVWNGEGVDFISLFARPLLQ